MDNYASRPLITALLLRRAARQANLPPADAQTLATVLRSRSNLSVAGQTLDDLQAGQGDMVTAKLGDGTLLSLLIANLPQILAAIMEILGALNKPTPTPTPGPAAAGDGAVHAAHASCDHAATAFALPAIPPALQQLLEEAAVSAVKAALTSLEPELLSFLREHGVL